MLSRELHGPVLGQMSETVLDSNIKAGVSARNEKISGHSEELSLCWRNRINKQPFKQTNKILEIFHLSYSQRQ